MPGARGRELQRTPNVCARPRFLQVAGGSPTPDGDRRRWMDSSGSSPPSWTCGARVLESLNWRDEGREDGDATEWDAAGLTSSVLPAAFSKSLRGCRDLREMKTKLLESACRMVGDIGGAGGKGEWKMSDFNFCLHWGSISIKIKRRAGMCLCRAFP